MNISRYIIPILVIVTLFGGYFLRTALTQPTTSVAFNQTGNKTFECVVTGLKCKGTANYFNKLYVNEAGIASIETFATEHTVIFTYDPSLTTPERLISIMEAPIPQKDGRHVQVFQCVEVKSPRE